MLEGRIKIWSLVSVVSFAVLCWGSVPVEAAILEVGSGKPYSTIQDAVNAASGGDEIIVYPGTYNETVSVQKSDLTIRAYANPGDITSVADRVTVVGGFSLYQAERNLFQGFYVQPTYSTACYSYQVSRNNTWRYMVVYGNTDRAAFGGANMYGSDILEHVTVYDMAIGGSYGYASSARVSDMISAFNADGWYSSDGSPISYSNWYDNPTGDSGYDDPGAIEDPNTTISADPLFYSTNPSDDYFLWLNPGSPSENVGSDGTNMGALPTIPEPVTIVLLGLGGVCGLLRRRGK